MSIALCALIASSLHRAMIDLTQLADAQLFGTITISIIITIVTCYLVTRGANEIDDEED